VSEIGASILDELPLGVWVGRVPDGAGMYANRAFRQILGRENVQESRIGDVPETYSVFTRAGQPFPVERLPFSQVVATGQAVVVEDLVIHRPDGGRVNLRAFGQPVRDAAGTLVQVIVAFIDITREVQAEEQRERTAHHLQFALDHAPVAIFSIDREGLITLSEGAGLKSLGVRSGQLVGQSVFDLYKDHPTIPSYIRRGLAGEAFWYTVQVGDAVYDSWLAPLRNPSGEIVGVMGLSNDVSEQRQLEARVIEADRVRAMGMLAASVAHEINNPLSYVLSCLRRVETNIQAADAPVREDLSTAIGGVDRIAAITRDLRTFSRPGNTAVGPVDVEGAIHSVLRLVRKEVEARARLRLFLAADRPVLGNEARLSQVLTNLVMNAVQSLPSGRPESDEIEISARVAGDQVVIEVGDSGPGVPPRERERIFEPFVTTKPIGGGTGLGLFVCRNIVRWMGGEISVEDRPGGGALFRVTLPAAPEPPPGARAVPPQPALDTTLSGTRILVIDDDEIVANMIVAQLAAAGADADAERDPERAVKRLLDQEELDLVFCDLMMSGRTGMDIAAAMKTGKPERLPRIIFMTGGAFTPKAAAFVAANPACCVDKPFDAVEEARKRLIKR
jgi:PAS domain S-box-containing protein